MSAGQPTRHNFTYATTQFQILSATVPHSSGNYLAYALQWAWSGETATHKGEAMIGHPEPENTSIEREPAEVTAPPYVSFNTSGLSWSG